MTTQELADIVDRHTAAMKKLIDLADQKLKLTEQVKTTAQAEATRAVLARRAMEAERDRAVADLRMAKRSIDSLRLELSQSRDVHVAATAVMEWPAEWKLFIAYAWQHVDSCLTGPCEECRGIYRQLEARQSGRANRLAVGDELIDEFGKTGLKA